MVAEVRSGGGFGQRAGVRGKLGGIVVGHVSIEFSGIYRSTATVTATTTATAAATATATAIDTAMAARQVEIGVERVLHCGWCWWGWMVWWMGLGVDGVGGS